MNQRFIYLASGSPRRRTLLDQVGIPYRVQPADIDETLTGNETPHDYVCRLARQKAEAVAASLDNDPVVLAADTTVVVGGEVLGKPRDRQDALSMLDRLSGRQHEVLTAVCVVRGPLTREALSETRVWFRPLSAGELADYWDTGEPADKAGAYSIQERAAVFVQRIDGSYSGVMGLPLFETAQLLTEFGFEPWRAD